MRKIVLPILTCFVLLGCNNQKTPDAAASAGKDTAQANAADTLYGPAQSWPDSLVLNYIHNSATFAQVADKDSIRFFFDRRENTDSAKYLVYQIGHSSENSFSSDQWLYIDSLHKSVYEYDVVDDKLVKWK